MQPASIGQLWLACFVLLLGSVAVPHAAERVSGAALDEPGDVVAASGPAHGPSDPVAPGESEASAGDDASGFEVSVAAASSVDPLARLAHAARRPVDVAPRRRACSGVSSPVSARGPPRA